MTGERVVRHGDCRDVLAGIDDCSIDAVVTDPPYGLEFMGKEWDSFKPASVKWADREHAPTLEAANDTPHHRAAVKQPSVLQRCANCGGNSSGQWNRCTCDTPSFRSTVWPMKAYQAWCEEWAAETFRVLKPGGHLLAFGGTRTYHRLVCALEDVGFEIRDSIHWVYGTGFPKSLDVSKAMGTDAQRWEGFGTALKPSHEPIVVARKPLIGTVVTNVLTHGTGALNIDACRLSVGVPDGTTRERAGEASNSSRYADNVRDFHPTPGPRGGSSDGRWPTNLVFSHDPECGERCVEGCPVAELDRQSGVLTSGTVGPQGFVGPYRASVYGRFARNEIRPETVYGDSGGASRFFPCFRYEGKASTAERTAGLPDGNPHPTVKPVELVRWLIRLVCPPGGVVLDPFAGSGSTLVAAALEDVSATGVEKDADYVAVAEKRVAWAEAKPVQSSLFDETGA